MTPKVMNKEDKKTVCITGTSKGLGYALICAFLKNTKFTIAAVTGNGETLRKKLGEESDSKRVKIIEASITDKMGREHIYEVLESLPELRVLIHNAGKLIFKPFREIGEQELTDIYKVNVFAPFLLTRELLPLMQKTHLITISSIGGVNGSLKFPGLTAYSSSKAALNCLTEMWAEEFKETDNTFNCLAMGSIETEMFQEAFPGVSAAATPEMMADYICNFAFDAPGIQNGKIISLSTSNP